MKARDVIGRTIVGVRQQRTATRLSGDYDMRLGWAWDVSALELDNGQVLILMGQATDTDPIVVAWVAKPGEETS